MPYAAIVGAIYMFVPMTVAIFVQKLIFKEPLKEPLGISWKINRWWLVAWFLPLVIAFATLGASLLLPGVGYSPDMAGIAERFKSMLPPEQFEKIQKQIVDFPIHPFWLGLVQGLIAGISVNALAGFGEELGWKRTTAKRAWLFRFLEVIYSHWRYLGNLARPANSQRPQLSAAPCGGGIFDDWLVYVTCPDFQLRSIEGKIRNCRRCDSRLTQRHLWLIYRICQGE